MGICSTSLAYAVDMGEILSAETKTGSITNPAQTDSFAFNGEAGQGVVINMSMESGDLRPEISLYAPDGTLEISSAYGYTHAEISDHQLLQSGTYTIVAGDYYGVYTGDYSLSFLLIPGPAVSPQDPDGGDILSGETKVGIIDFNADTDAYTFNGEAGQGVVINMSMESGDLRPEISLYAPDGTLEISSAYGYTHAEISDHQLLQSGTYTIVAGDYYGVYTGDYSLSFVKIPGTQHSPSIRIILNQDVFYTGDMLIISAHIINGPDPVNVEVKIWVHLPNGDDMSILDPHFTFTVEPNADFTTEIFSYTLDGSEPSGDYNVGGRFLNPISGRELSVNVESFSFSP